MDTKYIRDFSIIAHIDHGKNALAARMIELTGTISYSLSGAVSYKQQLCSLFFCCQWLRISKT